MNFRTYAFQRFLDESFVPRIYNPDVRVPQAKKEAPQVSALVHLMIHLVPIDKAKSLLNKFGLHGRKGITKSNLQAFKHQLMALVANHSPDTVRDLMAVNDPGIFKPAIDFWKAVAGEDMSSKVQSKMDSIHSIIPDEVNLLGDIDDSPKPPTDHYGDIDRIPKVGEKRGEDGSIVHQGEISQFPPVGAKLAHRLEWIASMERAGNFRLGDQIIRQLIMMKYKPTNLNMQDIHWDMVTNIIMYGGRGMDEKQASKGLEILDMYSKSVMNDITESRISENTLASLIDRLAANRIARLKAPELAFITKQYLRDWIPNMPIPKVRRSVIDKMITLQGDHRYFGEAVILSSRHKYATLPIGGSHEPRTRSSSSS